MALVALSRRRTPLALAGLILGDSESADPTQSCSSLGGSPRRALAQLADWACATNLPILCGPEGYTTCVASISECVTLLGSCSSPDHVRCADGTCTASSVNCLNAAAPCPDGLMMCADGSCEQSDSTCGPVPTCPLGAPARCADGACVTDAASCATLYPCVVGMERCADGQCALEGQCASSDGCGPSLPLLCTDRHCYAAGTDCALGCSAGLKCNDGSCSGAADGSDCPAPQWTHRPPRFSVRVATGVQLVLDIRGAIGTLTLPVGAFSADALLTVLPVADSDLALAQTPATWADWQRSIFSPIVQLRAAADGAAAPATPLRLVLTAALPSGVALSDACLGQLLQLDANRRLWRCAPGASLDAGGSSGTAGSSGGTTFLLSASLSDLGTYAVVFSSSAASAHPNLGDVLPPPPPPPAVVVVGASDATNATSNNSTSSSSEGSGFSAFVALLTLFLLMLSALISCYGLFRAGSPIEVERTGEDEPAYGKKVHPRGPLMPHMPGFSGE